MPTEAQIAVLCDIGQASQFDADKMKEVAELVAGGYAEPSEIGFKLTRKGEKLLTDRGAGLNES